MCLKAQLVPTFCFHHFLLVISITRNTFQPKLHSFTRRKKCSFSALRRPSSLSGFNAQHSLRGFRKILKFSQIFLLFQVFTKHSGFQGERVNPNVLPRRISTRLCFPLHLSHPPSIAYFSQCSCHKVTTLIQVHCTYENVHKCQLKLNFYL